VFEQEATEKTETISSRKVRAKRSATGSASFLTIVTKDFGRPAYSFFSGLRLAVAQ